MKNIIYYLFIVISIVSCGPDGEEKQVEDKKVVQVTMNATQVKNANIIEGTSKLQKIGHTIFANGTFEVSPQNKTVISAKMGGFVKSLEVLEGMSVNKGQVLLTLEHPEFIEIQQEFLEVIAKMPYLEEEMNRQKILVEKEAGNLKSLQAATSEWAVNKAKKSGLIEKLELLGINIKQLQSGNIQRTVSISSPINGKITNLKAEIGSYVEPSEHLLAIINTEHGHAEINVFEKDLPYIKIGQQVSLNFTNQNKIVNAKVLLIGSEIGHDRTLIVHCEIIEDHMGIAPGSYFKATINSDDSEENCIPSKAIVELNDKKVIFIKSNSTKESSTFIPMEIEILGQQNEMTAFRYKDKSRTYDQHIVINGAYDILSAFLIQQDNE